MACAGRVLVSSASATGAMETRQPVYVDSSLIPVRAEFANGVQFAHSIHFRPRTVPIPFWSIWVSGFVPSWKRLSPWLDRSLPAGATNSQIRRAVAEGAWTGFDLFLLDDVVYIWPDVSYCLRFEV